MNTTKKKGAKGKRYIQLHLQGALGLAFLDVATNCCTYFLFSSIFCLPLFYTQNRLRIEITPFSLWISAFSLEPSYIRNCTLLFSYMRWTPGPRYCFAIVMLGYRVVDGAFTFFSSSVCSYPSCSLVCTMHNTPGWLPSENPGPREGMEELGRYKLLWLRVGG